MIEIYKAEGMGLEAVGVSTLEVNDLGQSEKTGAAECAANRTLSNNDRDLAALLKAWPTLSVDDRRAILAIVERAGVRGQVQ